MSDYPRDQRNRGNGDNSGIPWPLIIIAFCIFWPVGILLLLLKFSQDAKLQQHKEDWVNALNNQDIPFAQRQEAAAQRQAERQAAQKEKKAAGKKGGNAQKNKGNSTDYLGSKK